MPDQRTIEQMHLHLDGVLGPEGESELRARLESDAETRRMFDDLKLVSEELGKVSPADPPPGLKAGVMAAVRGTRTVGSTLPFERSDARQRQRTIVARIGLGLAAAVAIAFILVPSLRQSIDSRHAAGTMSAPPAGAETTRTIAITGPGITGSIRTSAVANRLTVSVAPASRGDLLLEVAFDENVLSLDSTAGAAPAPADPASPGARAFGIHGGVTELKFVRRTSDATSIALKIREGQTEIFATNIDMGKSANF